MPGKERVLKFNRTDDNTKYILVNVKDRGPRSLDLKIEATEFDAEYALRLKHSDVTSLRAKNGPVDDGEWHTVLEGLLQHGFMPDIEATATVAEGRSISVIVRKSIQGISQRLGELTIPQIDGGELNVLEWCGIAVDAVTDCEKKVAVSTSRISQLENEVTELSAQVEELIKAKEEDETVLLIKFRDLLNEKKLKIREQQKVIAALYVSGSPGSQQPSKPPHDSQPALAHRKRKAQASRATKRKAGAPAVDEESDNGFESIEIDNIETEPIEHQDPEETDRGTESNATASTAGEGEQESRSYRAISSKTSRNQPLATKGDSSATSQKQEKRAQPPPKRSLPFAAKKSSTAVPGGEGSETASDDEL